MNQHVIQPTAEPVGGLPPSDSEKMRVDCKSLALSLRRWSHDDRASCRVQAAAGKHVSAFRFHQDANRKSGDALWYWRKFRRNT